MKSVSGKNWEEININDRLIEKIKIEHNLSIIQSKILVSRYFSETEIYSIKNDINFTNPFFENKDFLIGCELLKNNILKKNNILIIGDYDVDGCVSTSLIINFLKKININCNYYIPDRFKDGYGTSKKLIKVLIKKFNPKLIIFLDCGSSSHQELDYIKKLKISSIIIDHHNIEKPYPKSDVIINPKKKIGYNNDNLCSSFLTYLFLDLYITLHQVKISIKENLIYVLLATVADVMPIRNINRLLAINVLKNFDINKNLIFNNLFNLFKLKKKLELDDLGFFIAPVLNSAGRLENANDIVKLLTTTKKDDIIRISKYIYNLNLKRKLIEYRYLNEIEFDNISKQKGVIFIYKQNISEGLIGIIASRIKEQFNRPCIVFTNSSADLIKGSARSTSSFNIGGHIYGALKKNILIKGGGHNLAAGVTLSKSKLNLFKKFLNNYYLSKKIDLSEFFISRVSLSVINKNFMNEVNNMGPFGHGNTNPIFLFQNIKLIKPKILKNKFISCFIKSNNKMIKAISFNHLNSKISFEIMNSKNNVNLLAKIKENIWNNKSFIQLEIIDIIKHTNNT